MKTLREELEEYKSKVLAAFDEIAQYADDHRERAFVGNIRDAIKDVELPLPRHPEEVPLAVVADRKGRSVEYKRVFYTGHGKCLVILRSYVGISGAPYSDFLANNYAEAEAKARQYLEGLEEGK